MNKNTFLITATTVTVILYVLFFLACYFDGSSLFDRMYRPIIHVIAGPVSWLALLVFGQESKHNALLVILAIPILSGILWGFVVERVVYFLRIKRRKA